jgi:hypothetical protein
MAYIKASETRAIKARLVKAFPKFKFSVRNGDNSSVSVTIVSGPVRFDTTAEYKEEAARRYPEFINVNPEKKGPADHIQLNHYYLENYDNSETLKEMYAIINDGNYNNSDIMTDYFDVGFYVNMSAGAYNKPYEVTK